MDIYSLNCFSGGPCCIWIILRYIEDHEVDYIARLKEAVAIESVSAWADSRPNIVKMMEWTLAWVEKLGGTARLEVILMHASYSILREEEITSVRAS